MPHVSVVIPTYNRRSLVKEAIESVLKQTYSNFEVLVVDDGSTDDTRPVVEQVQDSRVKYYYKNNSGPAAARNLGLDKSKGRYISFLDSDDLWPPEYLETVIGQLDKNKDYGAAYTRVICVQQDGTRKEMSEDKRYKSGWMAEAFFQTSPGLFPSAICFCKSVWDNIFWDEQLIGGEDYDLFVRISVKTNFLFVPHTSIIKRWQPDNLSSNPTPVFTVNGARTLERFYFNLDGDKFITRTKATRKISHRYRKASIEFRKLGNRCAAILLAKKALQLYPLDFRLYGDLLKAYLLDPQKDRLPNWRMPVISLPVRSSYDNIPAH